ncbi:hypothetical protein AOLI_G00231090 [Acnodon oligacanthus]
MAKCEGRAKTIRNRKPEELIRSSRELRTALVSDPPRIVLRLESGGSHARPVALRRRPPRRYPRLRVAGEVKVRDGDGAIRSEQLLSAWSRSQRGPPACQAFECSHLGDS